MHAAHINNFLEHMVTVIMRIDMRVSTTNVQRIIVETFHHELTRLTCIGYEKWSVSVYLRVGHRKSTHEEGKECIACRSIQ